MCACGRCPGSARGGWTTPSSLQGCGLASPGAPSGGRSRGAGLQRGPRHPDICRWSGRTSCGAFPGASSILDPLLCSAQPAPFPLLPRPSPDLTPSLLPLSLLGCLHPSVTSPVQTLHSSPRFSPPSLIYLCISFLGNHQFPSDKQRRLPII